jgi:hypothetical protein
VRRIALLSILVLAVATVAMAPNAVGSTDTSGPRCADIVDGLGGYAYFQTDGVTPLTHPHFDFSISLADPACASIAYTLYVSLDNAAPYPVQGTASGTTVTFPTQTFNKGNAPLSICVYAQTIKNGGQVADRAPDAGCNTYNRGDFGGTLFH